MSAKFRIALPKSVLALFCCSVTVLLIGFAVSCGGGNSSMQTSSTGMIQVSISDPPSCMPPNGQFTHVFITVRSVQVHTSATADGNTPGWQEIAPQLANAPMQIDLFSKAQTNCILAQLGSGSLPVGSYQQIRLLLLSNSPGSGDAVPTKNACAGNGFNCVVLSDNSVHELDLSSQDKTGLKIPPGQIAGGPINVAAGQSVDLNIDFNACASIIKEGNGTYRLKPTLTAGQVSANNTGIGGQVIDAVTKAQITGNVLVAIEQPDGADSNGNFRFCPLPTGTFDIVAVAVGPNNLAYNATTVLNIPNGTNLGVIPLQPETGSLAPATLQGFVTASTGTAAASADVSMSALQTVSFGSPAVMRQLTIPLESIAATKTTSAVASTGLVSVSSSTTCPADAPANTNCAQYTLVVPASNPSVGVFNASGFSYSTPAPAPVPFTVDARAAVPNSGGVSDCSPSEIMATTDINNATLVVLPATLTTVTRTDFKGCS
jgi:hypothetical protein